MKPKTTRFEFKGSIFYAFSRVQAARRFSHALGVLVEPHELRNLPSIENESLTKPTDNRKAPGS